jgi:hypothetical protein
MPILPPGHKMVLSTRHHDENQNIMAMYSSLQTIGLLVHLEASNIDGLMVAFSPVQIA